MEVEVLRVDGVPADAIVSIRAGASRRQAPVSSLSTSNTPFRFAGGPAGVNPFKLDVLQPIGSARLVLKPGGGTFCVPMEGGLSNGVAVTMTVRDATSPDGDVSQELFDRIDRDRDGVISRKEFNDVIRRGEGDKPVLQPIADAHPIIVSPSGATRLPPLKKEEDDIRFKSASTEAKEYLEGHQLLPFVRALLQTVIRDKPGDPYTFIAGQFQKAASAADAADTAVAPDTVEEPKPPPGAPEDLAQVHRGVTETELTSKETGEVQALPSPPEQFNLQPSVGTWLAPAPVSVRSNEASKLEEAHELDLAKDRAREALTAVAKEVKEEEAPDTSELTLQKRLRALADRSESMQPSAISQEALDIVLRAEAEVLGADLAKLSQQEMGAAKLKAKAAMLASFQASLGINVEARAALEEALKNDGGHLSYTELDEAKSKMRKALAGALSVEEEALTSPELAMAKQKAQKALALSMMSDKVLDEELESTKATARQTLVQSLFEKEEDLSEDELKVKARQALSVALLGDAEVENLKAAARDALSAVLQDEGAESIEDLQALARNALSAVLQNKGAESIEDLQALARNALSAVLQNEGAESMEDLKSAARDSLMAALMDSSGDPGLESAKLKAREALYASLMKDGTPKAKLAKAKSQAREALTKALLEDDQEGVEEAKKRARDALRTALLEDDEDMEAVKSRACIALQKALLKEDDDDSAEVEAAKAKCREALTASLLGPVVNKDDIELAKEKARLALAKSLLEDQDQDLDAAKAKARAALAAAMASDDEDEDQALKSRAADALAMALLNDEAPAQVVEDAKSKARAALTAALLADEEADDSAVRERAQEALEKALLGDEPEQEDLAVRAKAQAALEKALLGDELEQDDLAVRAKAQAALEKALLGDEPVSELDASKARARAALSQALLGNSEAEAKPESSEIQEAKQRARDALSKALLEDQASVEKSPEVKEVDEELAEAERVKAQLLAAKDQMTNFNVHLRDEVDDLKNSLKDLMKERDALKQRLAK